VQQRSIASFPRWTNRPLSAAEIARSFCWRPAMGCDLAIFESLRSMTSTGVPGALISGNSRPADPLHFRFCQRCPGTQRIYPRRAPGFIGPHHLFTALCTFRTVRSREQPDGERARSPSAHWPCRTTWPAGSLLFRHTLATQLLAAGRPLKTIADVLGHASTEATYGYTRVELAGLRGVAISEEEVSR